MKKALITGVAGQDGFYLSRYLKDLGYEVWGLDIAVESPAWVDHYIKGDICHHRAVEEALMHVKPNEIYHLAAYHHSADSVPHNQDILDKSYGVHTDATLNILMCMKSFLPQSRLFYASSCLVFGQNIEGECNEATPFNPTCSYGITKLAGMRLCSFFRTNYGIFASSGILFNHESPHRPSNFVTQKIVQGACAIKRGSQATLNLGNLDTRRDWGYAGDYASAMHSILQLDDAADLVISTGISHTVGDFVKEAFSYLGLDWSKHVALDDSLVKNHGRHVDYIGNNHNLVRATGWSPSVPFSSLVHMMVDAQMESNDG